ncbi:hypothetical protein OPV22_029291 [Ensete ventricosum]|uniref:Uncharacterized protein n=1 Tax=Ensete ventricosum TaxID=4639 RepID=A0AAV8Q5F1_ENSVE|nr:hypothetical protein OPV22_029291 [Ensete ventricosum]
MAGYVRPWMELRSILRWRFAQPKPDRLPSSRHRQIYKFSAAIQGAMCLICEEDGRRDQKQRSASIA